MLFGKQHMFNARNCNIGMVVYSANIVMCEYSISVAFASTYLSYMLLTYDKIFMTKIEMALAIFNLISNTACFEQFLRFFIFFTE